MPPALTKEADAAVTAYLEIMSDNHRKGVLMLPAGKPVHEGILIGQAALIGYMVGAGVIAFSHLKKLDDGTDLAVYDVPKLN